jgi:murein DD-endopeptidase MepM/ murein hydrolase activator NlpD
MTLPFRHSEVTITSGWIYDVPQPNVCKTFPHVNCHQAIDYAGGGFDVLAVASGRAMYVPCPPPQPDDPNCTTGKRVITEHIVNGVKYTTTNAHLESTTIPSDRWTDILRGQKLGVAGATGIATGIHLHFKVRRNNLPVDPYGIYSTDNFYPDPDNPNGPNTCGSHLWTVCPPARPLPLVGDLNNDGIVNSLDWSIMNGQWLTNNPTSDLNDDGIVNSLDFSLMNSNWLKTVDDKMRGQ